ncbi:MAG TPA: hypothetical protein VK395_16490 [Gemmataceae bacterium]|nr:hypothetical protein [Gemmataceae bacterium]
MTLQSSSSWIAATIFFLAPMVYGGEPDKLPAEAARGEDSVPVTAPAGSTLPALDQPAAGNLLSDTDSWQGFKRFESDHAFDRFIGPITNPVLSKDPRSLTEARLLFIQDEIDPKDALGGGDFQVYAMQLRLALSDRLTLIADKDGIASIHPKDLPGHTGFINLAAGLKYDFIRDVEDQFLLAGGLMFEPQTGEGEVFQNQGDGLFTLFLSAGKEFACYNHVLANLGYEFPVDRSQNSSFVYTSLHIDRQLFGWLYPLAELNWYHWLSSGDRGLPPSLGEGDGLLNLGTSGVAGNDLVTAAVGLKARLNTATELGTAWEFPISNRHDLINNRLTVELIFRY